MRNEKARKPSFQSNNSQAISRQTFPPGAKLSRHIADLANVAFDDSTIAARIAGNDCVDSQTCVIFEHIENGLVLDNKCSSQAVGVELHDSAAAIVKNNVFDFSAGAVGCEILSLSLGDKIDLSRVNPGAGTCANQREAPAEWSQDPGKSLTF